MKNKQETNKERVLEAFDTYSISEITGLPRSSGRHNTSSVVLILGREEKGFSISLKTPHLSALSAQPPKGGLLRKAVAELWTTVCGVNICVTRRCSPLRNEV